MPRLARLDITGLLQHVIVRGIEQRDIFNDENDRQLSITLKLDPDLIMRPSKSRGPAAARAIICHLAKYELGFTGTEIGKFLHLGSTGVSLASRRGEKALKADVDLHKEIMGALET